MKPKFFLAKSIATLFATSITLTSALHALPQGEQVRAGTATFDRVGTALNIRTGERAIIDYRSFNIGGGERVSFIQPSALSITLNRVTDPNPSHIFGTLTSNGHIVLANPYGIYFESGSVVNVGGLIAGAGRITDSDFLAGRINFSNLSGDVENRGNIIAINDVALYGEHVTNAGSITSQKGAVTLAAGSSVYVGEAGGNIFVGSAATIPKARVVSRPGVSNTGSITAPKASLVAGDMYGIAIAQSGNIVSGDITIAAGTGGSVDVSGRLDASNRATGKSGGKIKIKGDAITVHDATLDASGHAGGGTIVLDGGHNAATPTTVTSSGKITARGEGSGAKGGTVQMLGDHVGLFEKAIVDVSGDAGGGTALLGGDYQGKNPNIQNAARTYISLDAQIHADALTTGDGGKVIVWADVWTKFYGTISARGGAVSGDGGFVETSGKGSLAFSGRVDTFSPTGKLGILLLDPKFIEVKTLGGTAYDPTAVTGNNTFSTPDATSTQVITPASITLAVADVILQANDDVTFTDSLAMVKPGQKLTVQAGRSILINNNISTTNGAISFTANETVANGVVDAQRDAGAAVISMAPGTAISAGSANITLTISTGPTTNSTSGNITLAGLTTTGDVLIASNGPTAGSGIVRVNAASLITATTAALDVNGAGLGGGIGSLAAPVRVAVTNLSARSQSGGAFFDSPNGGVTLGGAALGGLTGIAISGGGSVQVNSKDALAVLQNVITGTGTISLQANQDGIGAQGFSQTDGTTISGTGIAITVNTATTLLGAGGGAVVSNISDAGALTITTNNAGNNSAGNITRTAASTLSATTGISLSTGAGAIGTGTGANAINLASGQTNVSATAHGGAGNIFLTDVGALTIGAGGITTTGGQVDVRTTGAGALTATGAILSGGGAVTLSSQDALAVNGGIVAVAGSVSLFANQDGVGAEGFLQANATTISGTGIAIQVNTAGTLASVGGGAVVSNLTDAGALSITTNNGTNNSTGDITRTAASTISAATTATFTTGVGKIGTGTGVNAINFAGGQTGVSATTHGGSVFLNGAGSLNVTSVTTTGLPNAAGGTVNIATAGAGNALTIGTITATGGVAPASTDGLAGGTVTLSSGDVLTIGAGGISTAGSAGMNPGVHLGGNAGNINLTSGGAAIAIVLNGDLNAGGGLRAGGPVGNNGVDGTVTTNGSVSPGGDAVVRTENITGNLSLASGKYYVTIGATSDQLAVSGGVNIAAGVTLDGQGSPAIATAVIPVITSGTPVVGTFTPATPAMIGGRTYAVSYPGGGSPGVTLTGSATMWFWVGGVTGTVWNAPVAALGNWTSVSGSVALVNRGQPASGDQVVFDSVNATTSTSDFNYTLADLALKTVTFNRTAAFSVNYTGTKKLVLTDVTGGLSDVSVGAFTNLIAAPMDLTNAIPVSVANAGVTLALTGAISGTGGLDKSGAGALTISGANTFGGGVTLTSGTLNINSTTALGAGVFTILSGTIDNTTGGTLTLVNNNAQNWNGDFTFTGTQALNLGTGAVSLNADRTVTVAGSTLTENGVIGGAFSLAKSGAGALTLGGANTFGGAGKNLTLGAGTLNLNNATAAGGAGNAFVINGGTLDNTSGAAITTANYALTINGDFAFTGTQNLNLGTGVATLGAAAGTSRTITANGGTLTLAGAIADGATANALVKSGAGALTLAGANTFTGGLTLNAGTLNINSTSALGAAVGAFVINGGTMDNTSGAAIATLNYPITINGDFAFTGGAGTTHDLDLGTGATTLGTAAGTGRTITANAGTLTIGGAIANGTTATALTKAGAGKLVLAGDGTFTGLTTISAGMLQLGAGGTTGSVAGNVTDNGVLVFNRSNAVTFAGTITGTGNLTVAQSGGITFSNTIAVAQIAIADTAAGQTVAFQGDTSATAGMTVAATANAYHVSLTGTTNTIGGATAFNNGGNLTLGNGGDTFTFAGGLNTTAVGGIVTVNGTVNTTNTALTLGAVTLGGVSTFNAGSGVLSTGAITGGGNSLTILGSGANTVASTSGINALALNQTGGSITFTGNTAETSVTTLANLFGVTFQGTTNTVTNAVNFTNTGALTLGVGGGDTFTFAGGLNTTAVGSTVTVNGTVNTTNTALTLGAVTLGGASTFNAGSGVLSTGAITGGGNSLTILGSGANTVASTSGIDTLALNQTGGSITFTGNTAETSVTMLTNLFDVTFQGTTNTVTNAVNFTNTGALTLGVGGGDTFTFAGGLNTTAVGGLVTVNGTVNTTNTALTLGAVTLAGDSTLNSNATTTAGDITLGAVTGGGFNLTLQTGNPAAGADVNGTSVTGVGTLQLQSIGGTASFTGAVNATTFNVPATVVNVSSTGTGGTITNAFAPANTGTLTLGQVGGTQNFTGGLDTTAVGVLVTVCGTLNTTNTALMLGAVTLASDTFLNTNATTTAGDITLGAVTGGGFNLTLQTGLGIAGADVNGTSVTGVNTLQLQNIGGTASFTGAVNVTTFNVPATVVNVSSTGTGGTVTNLFTPVNTGTLTLGQGGGTQTYAGGLNTAGVGGTVTLNGTIQTNGGPLTLGAVTLNQNTILATTNGFPAGAALTIGAVTGNTFTLGLDAGTVGTINGTSVDNVSVLTIINSAGTTFTGTIGGTVAGAVNLTDSTGTIAFKGDTHITTLTTASKPYNVAFTGTTNVVNNAATFLNTGTLTLGDGGDTIAFTGGVVATAQTGATAGILLNGTVSAAGTGVITLGDADTGVSVLGNSLVGGTSTGLITMGNALLADGVTLTVGTGVATPINLAAVSGTAGGLASNLTMNTTGAVNVAGVVGTDIGTLTVVNSGGATFASAVSAGTISILNTGLGQTVAFQGNTSATTGMTVAAGTAAYRVSLTGAFNTIAGTTIFNNTGTLTLGDQITDTVAFTGGVVATAPSSKNIAGAITAAGVGVINLGTTPVNVTDTALVGGTSTGLITLGNATIANAKTLTVGTGVATPITTGSIDNTTLANSSNVAFNTTGIVTVTGAVGATQPLNSVTVTRSGGATFASTVRAASVAILDTVLGQTVAFQGNTTATTGMTVAAGTAAYNVSLTGALNTIAGATTFNNTGTVTLGDQSTDALAFTGGVVATAPSLKNIAGTITAAGAGVIHLGTTPVNVTDNATVGGTSTGLITLGNATIANTKSLTVGTGIANAINLGSVIGNAAAGAETLTINTTGVANVSGAVGAAANRLDQLTVTRSGGATFASTVDAKNVTIADTVAAQTVAFLGNLTVSTGMAVAAGTAAYNVSLTGTTNTIAGATTFNNTGVTTIGDQATDTTTFAGGVVATAPAVRTAGTILTNGGASASFGGPTKAITLIGDTAINTGAGAVTFGGTVSGPFALNVSSSGTTTFAGTVGIASIQTDLGGTTVLPSLVSTSGSQNFFDAVKLVADTTLASNVGDINLFSTVNAAGHALTLSTAGNAILGATISGLSALNPFVNGTTTIGTALTTTDITVPNELTFPGPVAVRGNVVIATTRTGSSTEIANTGAALRFNQTVNGPGSLTANAGGVLTFAGTVGAVTALDSLSANAPIINLSNARTQNTLTADARTAATTDGSDGFLNLTGNTYASLGGSVQFNPTNRTTASKHATILSTAGDLSITAAGSFIMGNEQKLLVNNGGLTIFAGGSAIVGDMAASTRINLTASSVFLQGRALNGFFNSNRKDNGLGFVSPTISFSTSNMSFLSGTTQKAVFSTRDSIASVRQIAGVSLEIDKDIAKQFSKQDLKVDGQFQPVVPNVIFGIVQPIASGTRVTEPGQIQVVFVLEIPKLVELPQDTFLSKSVLDVLARMGIYPRDATSDENITVSLRRGVFRQPIEGKADMEDPEYMVVVNRLTKEEVEAIVTAYTELAGKDFENLDKIATILGEEVEKFKLENPSALGLEGFTKWLQAQREKDKAAEELAKNLDELASVFVRLARIGLTKKEVTICKLKICALLKAHTSAEIWDIVPLVEGGAPAAPQAPRPGMTAPPPEAPPADVPPAEATPGPLPPAPLPPPTESAATPPADAATPPPPAPLPPAPDSSAPVKPQ